MHLRMRDGMMGEMAEGVSVGRLDGSFPAGDRSQISALIKVESWHSSIWSASRAGADTQLTHNNNASRDEGAPADGFCCRVGALTTGAAPFCI